jgi:cell wall-associated NlpC family hydrolase
MPGASSDLEKRWQSVYEEVLGLPYRAGGVDRKGFDCSGLVQFAYRRFDGRRLPRTAQDQYRTGRSVKRDKTSTGDLLFYRTEGKHPSHVGIYLWDGWFLHATPREGVTLTPVNDRYYAERYLGARRLP